MRTELITHRADLGVGRRALIAVVVNVGVQRREHVVANRARLIVVLISDVHGSSQTFSIHRRICNMPKHTQTV